MHPPDLPEGKDIEVKPRTPVGPASRPTTGSQEEPSEEERRDILEALAKTVLSQQQHLIDHGAFELNPDAGRELESPALEPAAPDSPRQKERPNRVPTPLDKNFISNLKQGELVDPMDAGELPIKPRGYRKNEWQQPKSQAERFAEENPELLLRRLGKRLARTSKGLELVDLETAKESGPEKEEREIEWTPFENRDALESTDKKHFHENWYELWQESKLRWLLSESAFAKSLHGKLTKFPLTGWLFNRRTRALETVILGGSMIAVSGLLLAAVFFKTEVFSANRGDSDAESLRDPGLGARLLAGRDQAAQVTRQFFQAQSLEQILPTVRHREVLEPVMVNWYANFPHRQESELHFDDVRIRRMQGSRFYLQFIRFAHDTQPRPIAVEETPDGFRVDWETAIGYQPMSWAEYRIRRPAKPVNMRVIAKLDHYYNYGFHEEAKWSCYRLSHPDEERSLYGYIPRYTEFDNELRAALDLAKSRREYFILTLRYPDNPPADNQVLIDAIFQKKWVVPYQEGDRHFDL